MIKCPGKWNPGCIREVTAFEQAFKNIDDILHKVEFKMNDVLAALFDGDGKLKRWPKKAEEKMEVLQYFQRKFEKGREYTEKEVNAIISGLHTFNDITMLRRELIAAHLMNRTPDCRKYWIDQA